MSPEKPYSLIFIYAFRIYLCILRQPGYIQPDEFFQFTEPIADGILQVKSYLPWEFTTSEPLRSIFLPYLVSAPIFMVLKYKNCLTPYLLLVLPRLIVTLASFLCDYCLHFICKSFKSTATKQCLIVFGTSYIALTYLTHTFTNSLELILFSALLYYVCRSLSSKRKDRPSAIGAILALGMFNRPTFGVFSIVPLLFWSLNRKYKTKLSQLLHIGDFLPAFALVALILVAADTWFYKNLTIDELTILITEQKWSQLLNLIVITPLNFLKYNTKESNLKNHGLHPFHQHFIVNVPLAFSILGLFAYKNLIGLLSWTTFLKNLKKLNKTFTNLNTLMLGTFLVSLLLLSLIPHQEPRFLLPLLLPLCFLYAPRVYNNRMAFTVWIVINLVSTLMYGFIHQAGVIKALFEIRETIQMDSKLELDIIFARTYLPPQHLLAIPKTVSSIRFHDLSILEFPEAAYHKLKELKTNGQTVSEVYLAIPSCLKSQVETLFKNLGISDFSLHKHIFPHFTAEDLSSSLEVLLTKQHWSIQEAFGFHIWKLKLR